MSKVFIEESTLTTIGDAIRAKAGTSELIAPQDMGDAITNLPSGGGEIPEEAFLITGDCSYRFAYNSWNWFIENYGNQITTQDITNCTRMFIESGELEQVPFEINFSNSTSTRDISRIFQNCYKLKSFSKINNCKLQSTESLFLGCNNLRNLPEGFENSFDYSYLDSLTNQYSGNQPSMFKHCYSLRSIPMGFLEHGNPSVLYSYSYFYYGFYQCRVLDELVDLPIPYTATWTNNALTNTFDECCRLKTLTFKTPNGQPYTMNWKKQTIDLSWYIGYAANSDYIMRYNSGITADKRVTDDTTYVALKNDPDWWTTDIAYSRYNHDSAVATINSLPDTSAYLASAGGTNTIKFKGAAGSATDGGAINTLTEQEIAVATAKGWTVTLV